MKTKACVVLRFEVLVLGGFCYLFSVVLDCEQAIIDSKGNKKTASCTRICARGYDAASLKLCFCPAQMFGQVNFHVNKLNINHLITNCLAVILIL